MSTAAEMRQQLKDLAKERAELESKIVDMQTVERYVLTHWYIPYLNSLHA